MATTIKEQLRHWAHYQEHRYCSPVSDEDVPTRDEHPLARARQFAPGNKANRQQVPRDGVSRRTMMGDAAGLRSDQGRVRPVAKWFVDPIPCIETRLPAPRSPSAAVTIGSPDDYRWIDRALSMLHRHNMLRALVVLEEFTGRGSQAERAKAVAAKYGGALTKWQYRKELEKGMAFMEARRA